CRRPPGRRGIDRGERCSGDDPAPLVRARFGAPLAGRPAAGLLDHGAAALDAGGGTAAWARAPRADDRRAGARGREPRRRCKIRRRSRDTRFRRTTPAGMSDLYDFSAKTLSGAAKGLADYRGKVVLVVNNASECGFTPQYEGLEAISRKYRDKGLEVLGFPCNQFGAQEPGSAADIGAFCEKNYGVSFQMFDKIEVNGPGAHPLYQWLTHAAPGILGT